jgi:hypothetical protein
VEKFGDMLSAISANVRWGAWWGFGAGCVYSLFQLGFRIVLGPEFFAKYNVTAQQIIPVYIAGATIAGVIVGLARPLVRWLLGAMVVGAIAGVPFMIGVSTAMDGPVTSWTGADWSTAIGSGILLGLVAGFMLWWKSPYAGAPPKGRPDEKTSRKLFQHWKP